MSSDIKDQRFVHSVEAKEQTCKFLGIKCCTGISRVCSPRISKIQKMHVDISLESQRFKRFVGIKSRPASNLKDSLESTRTSCQIINGDIQKPRYLYLYTVGSESILDGSPLAIRRKGGVEDFKRTILRDEQQAAPVCSCSVQSSKTQDAEDSRLHDRIAALQ